MKRFATVFKYEMFNALRSKWLYVYTALLGLFVFGFTYLTDDFRKSELALISVLTFLVPLVSILFTTAYWYSSENFTELLLSQPVSRRSLYWARIMALVSSLSLSLLCGLVLVFLVVGIWDWGIAWLFAASVVAGTVFCFLGALIATYIIDRMWGIGLGLALWFYFVAIHDALLLLVLYWFRDYPLDAVSAALCGLNPLALLRVTLLMHFDAPLLLGHSGALIRKMVESGSGFSFAAIVMAVWLVVPAVVAGRKFSRRDF